MNQPTQQPTNWQQPEHSFPDNFQWQVCKLMVSDQNFLIQAKNHLPIEFFSKELPSSEFLIKAVEIIYQHSNSAEFRNLPPTQLIFENYLAQKLAKMDVSEQGIYSNGFQGITNYLYSQDWSGQEVQYVRDNIFKWIKDRASRALTVDIKNGIDRGKTLEDIGVDKRLKEIQQIGFSTLNDGIDLFGDALTTWNWLNTKEFRSVLSTGSPHFDKVLMGGYGRKELTTYIAPPNVGKSTVMCDQTGKLVRRGRSGMYISLEQSDLLIMMKIMSSIMQIIPAQWMEHKELVWQWAQWFAEGQSRLAIQQFPSGRITTNDIEASLLNRATQWGHMPDFLVLDYADLLRPINRYENFRHQLTEIYTDLRGIAVEYDIAIITASQANRGAVGAQRVSIEDLAEAFDKAAISDVMIGISQTEEEHQNSRARLYLAKNRIGPKHVEIPVTLNFALSCMYEEEQRIGLAQTEVNAQDVMSNLAGMMGQPNG